MATCTFFGHRNTDKKIEPTLRSTLIQLIENENIYKFYVGNHGNFDFMVIRVLKELKEIYPIDYAIILAYMPTRKDEYQSELYSNAILPDGIENVPKKFAISYRNKFMIEKSDYVIAHVTHTFGGAWQFTERAKRKNKIVINIA